MDLSGHYLTTKAECRQELLKCIVKNCKINDCRKLHQLNFDKVQQ